MSDAVTSPERPLAYPALQLLLLGVLLGALHYALMRIIGAKMPFNIFVPWLLCSSIVAMMAGAWVHHRRRAQGRVAPHSLALWGFVLMAVCVAFNLKVPTLFWANTLLGGIDIPVLEPTLIELHMAAELGFFLSIPLVYYGLGVVFAKAYEASTRPHRAYGWHLVAFALGGGAAYAALGRFGMMPIVVGLGLMVAAFLLPSRRQAATFMLLLVVTSAVSHAAPNKFFMWSVQEHRPIRDTMWSPYYKLDFHHFGDQCVATISNNYLLYYTCEDPIMDHLQRREVFKVLAPDRDSFLVVGASGGVSMQTFRKHNPDFESGVGIEVDPATVEMALGQMRDYNADVFHDPRVRLIQAEGREFLERTKRRYDLIYLDGVDNRQFIFPMSSVSVESYLFTKEGIATLMDSLSDDGVLLIDVGGTSNDAAIPFVAAFGEHDHYDLYWYVVSDYPMVGLPLFFIFASRSPEALAKLRPKLDRIDSIERAEKPCFEQGCIGDGYEAATDDRPFLYQYSLGVQRLGWIPVIAMLGVVRWLFMRMRRREPDDPSRAVYPYFVILGALYGAAQSVLVLQGSRKLLDPALASTLLIAGFLIGNAIANFWFARRPLRFGLFLSAVITALLAWSLFTELEGSNTIFAVPMAIVGGFALGWLWPRAIAWLPAERRALALAMDGAGVLVGITATQWVFAAYGLTQLKWLSVALCVLLCGLYVRHERVHTHQDLSASLT